MLTMHVIAAGSAAGLESRVEGPYNHHHCPQAVYNLGFRLHCSHPIRLRTGAGHAPGTQPNSRRSLCKPPDVPAGRLCPCQMNDQVVLSSSTGKTCAAGACVLAMRSSNGLLLRLALIMYYVCFSTYSTRRGFNRRFLSTQPASSCPECIQGSGSCQGVAMIIKGLSSTLFCPACLCFSGLLVNKAWLTTLSEASISCDLGQLASVLEPLPAVIRVVIDCMLGRLLLAGCNIAQAM